MAKQVLEQSIQINASAVVVDRCITELDLQQRWRSGQCLAVGEWSGAVGSHSRLIMKWPWWQFSLHRVIVVREPGLVIWSFDGLISGRDQWECRPRAVGTLVVNRWELQTNNTINWVWQRFNRQWTSEEMAAQLMRLKYVAEEIYYLSGFQ